MPRTISAPALATLLAQEHWHWLKIEIADPDGVLRDMRVLQSVDWQDEVTVSSDVDRTLMAGSVRLRLDTDTVSLAPTMGGSLANRNAANNYAWFLQPDRDIIVSIACTAPGVSPIAGDWHTILIGVIDDVRYGEESQTYIELACRDVGARIMDRWLMRKYLFGDPAGMPLKDALFGVNGILTQTFGYPPTYTKFFAVPPIIGGAIPTYIPVDPPAVAFQWEQEPGPTLDVMHERALQVGWDLRHRYKADETFPLTLWQPARGNIVPDWTLTTSQYRKITALDVSKVDVRNWVEIEFFDRASGTRKRVQSLNNASITKYDQRWMELILADDDIIDSVAEAQTLADNAANDLGEPWATHELEMDLFWPVQEGDVIQLPSNLVHYDSAQIFAVVGFKHELKNGEGVTTLSLRGTVTGSWKDWIRREAQSQAVEDQNLRVKNFREEGRDATQVTLGWEIGGKALELWLWILEYDQPVVGDPWPTFNTPNPIRLTPDTTQYTVALPRNGKIKYGLLLPIDASFQPGVGRDFTVQPNDALPLIYNYKQTAGVDGLHRDLAFLISDPAGLGGTLRAWTNHDDFNDASPDVAVEATLPIVSTDPPYLADNTRVFALTAGGTSNLLNELRVHPGKGKRIFFEFVNSQGVSSGVQHTILTPGTSPVDENNQLIAGIISTLTPFAADIKPVRIYSTFSGNNGAYVGEPAVLTTDQKLYRWTGAAWTAAVPATDMTGQITATQITDLSISTPKLAAGAVTTAKIAAGAVTATEIAADTITAGQIAAGAIGVSELAANAVTATAIAAGAVTAGKISVSTLAAITSDAGIIVAGKLQNAGGTQYLDLNAAGASGFLVHPKLSLLANGNAEFTGDLSLAEAGNTIYFKRSGGATIASMAAFVLGSGGTAVTGIRVTVYGYVSGSATIDLNYDQANGWGQLVIGGALTVTGLLSLSGGHVILTGADGGGFGYDMFVDGGTGTNRRVAKVIVSSSAASGAAPDGTIWMKT